MGMLKFEVSHRLSKDEARKRVDSLLGYWNQKYGLKVDWSGDTAKLAGKAMGISLTGNLSVLDSKVSGEATDPGFLLREKARKYITSKFEKALDPAGAASADD